MSDTATRSAARIFVVLNPVSGRTNKGDIYTALERHLPASGRAYEVFETTGADEEIGAAVRDAIGRGFDMVAAAGGDGTVSAVAEALVGSEIPLAIIPAGTANVFGRELGLPIDIDAACALLAGDYVADQVDVMQVGDQYFVLQIEVGIGSLMVRDTSRELKERFGRLAYIWNAARALAGAQSQRVVLVIDGRRLRLNASEVLIANGGTLGVELFRWGPGITPDDGHVDVCVVTAQSLRDYLVVIWHTLTGQHRRNPRLRYFQARESISVNPKRPLPIQADGEIIGKTPLQVRVVPGALTVAVPPRPEPEAVEPAATAPALQERTVGTPLPGEERIEPEERAAAAPVEQILKQKLSQIRSPDQASRVAEELLAASGEIPEQKLREQGAAQPDPAQAVAEPARKPGERNVANTLIAAAEQLATASGERREALDHAIQRATNPEQRGEVEPELAAPLAMLRAEILRRMRPWQAVDARLFLAINHLPHPPLANQAMYGLTSVMNGGMGWMLGLLGSGLLSRKAGLKVLRDVAPPLWLATMTVEYPIKTYFRRRRPFISIVQAISVGRRPGSYSFPSGHSAAAFAGAWLISRHYPRLAALWYTIAALVGFSRIYLGAHYPGDVLSGAVIGTIIAEATRRLSEDEP